MRSESITNPIESLTPEEKERLGFLVMWSLDGPEQGFITAKDVFKLQIELYEFLAKNDIPAGGQWVGYAKGKLAQW